MTGALVIEIHGWRGVRRETDLFLMWVRLGFVTVGVSRPLVTERIRQLHNLKAKFGLS